MTRILSTTDYLVGHEPRHHLLTIARRSDGQCLGFRGVGVAGDFRDALAKYGPERTLETYLRAGRDQWSPLYKPGRVPA